MKRRSMPPRPDLAERAADLGFTYLQADGETYWDESACYAFTLQEIERDLEAPTSELAALCHELVGRLVDNDARLRQLDLDGNATRLIQQSWERHEPSIYGRFDLAYDGRGPAKMLEYNADTPTSLYEAAVFQWFWLQDFEAVRRAGRRRRPI